MTSSESHSPAAPHATLRSALLAASPAQADGLMRAASVALACLQCSASGPTLTAFDAARLQADLALFPEWCAGREFGVQWDAEAQARWQRVSQALVASASAQPVVPLHGEWTVDRMPWAAVDALAAASRLATEHTEPALKAQANGPVAYDLVCLLRDVSVLTDPPFPWDGSQELDWAIRYWQAALAAGVPISADFGEFWRDFEWLSLQHHLVQMGELCRHKHAHGVPLASQQIPSLLAAASKAALRYSALKPLLRLLEPLSGPAVAAGYTF